MKDKRLAFVSLVLGGQLVILIGLAIIQRLTIPAYVILAGFYYLAIFALDPTNLPNRASRRGGYINIIVFVITVAVAIYSYYPKIKVALF